MPIIARIRGQLAGEVAAAARELQEEGLLSKSRPRVLDKIAARTQAVAQETDQATKGSRSILGAILGSLRESDGEPEPAPRPETLRAPPPADQEKIVYHTKVAVGGEVIEARRGDVVITLPLSGRNPTFVAAEAREKLLEAERRKAEGGGSVHAL